MDFVQCRLRHDNVRVQVTYLPKKFAEKGRRLRLLDEEGWEVTDTYGSMPGRYVLEHERDYMKTRQATDI